jgi:hypothetical protein
MRAPIPAYQGDQPYVFVCYAHDDADVVYPELAWLRAQGVNVWYDEGIAPGAEWSQALADALDGCSAVLFYVSPRSVASEHCRREINFALSRKRPICAVHIQETELPGALELSLGHRQALLRHRLPAATYQEKLRNTLAGVEAQPFATTQSSHRGARIWLVAVGGSMLAALIGGVLWWQVLSDREPGYPDTAITVLPFEDLSPDRDQAWLSGAMVEALQTYLSRIDGLRVATLPPSLAARLDPAELAARLRVGSAVGGSIQRQGDTLRVNARLLRRGLSEQRSRLAGPVRSGAGAGLPGAGTGR